MVDCGVAGSATGFTGTAESTGDSGAPTHRYCYAPAKALDNTKKTQSQNKQQTQHKPLVHCALFLLGTVLRNTSLIILTNKNNNNYNVTGNKYTLPMLVN